MQNEKPIKQMVEAIFALNPGPIKAKLMDTREGHGWTRAQADHNEPEYKRFLALRAIYPDKSIASTTEVCKFWHGHILDTGKYAEDTPSCVWFILHHFPYSGMRGEENAANLVSAFENMLRVHDRKFGAQERMASHESAWQGMAARQPDAAYLYGSKWNAPSGQEMGAAAYRSRPAPRANAESA